MRIVLRRLLHNPLYTIIGAGGLAIGMTCALLVFRYVAHELSFDRHHPRPEHTYRVVLSDEPRIPPPLVALMQDHVSGVQSVARLMQPFRPLISRGDRRTFQSVHLGSDALFRMLAFPFLDGDPLTALQTPRSVVLSAETARHYFDRVDVVGQTLEWDQGVPLVVTGVVDIPPTSHLRFDVMLSYNSISGDDPYFSFRYHDDWRFRQSAYVALSDNVTPAQFLDRTLQAVEHHLGADRRQELITGGFGLQPVTDIRLHSPWSRSADLADRSNIDRVLLVAAIGALVLLLAGVNFSTLALAHWTRHAEGLSVRRTLGAGRWRLASESVLETLLLCGLSLAVALGLGWLLEPAFSTYLGVQLAASNSFLLSLAAVSCVAVVTAIIAGAYPAFVTARARPQYGRDGWGRVLIGSQFAIAAALIACTVVVRNQLTYMRAQDLGLDTEQVVVLQTGYPGIEESRDLFVERLEQHDAVRVATPVRGVPGTALEQSGVFTGPQGQSATLGLVSAEPGFLDLFNIPLVAGTGLRLGRDERESSADNEMVLNRAAVRALGFANVDDVLSRRLSYDFRGQTRSGVVVGVMENFHVESLHQPLPPMALTNEFPSATVAAKLDPLGPGLQHVRETWAQMYPDWPLELTFVDEAFEQAYRQDERLGQALAVFAGLAIVIACLGVFALAAFSAQLRTREIGVRRVLGAGVGRLAGLLTIDFVRIASLAALAVMPLVWWGMSSWIEGFAYRIQLDPVVFAGSALFVVFVSAASAGVQALRTALHDPVEALRHD